MEGVETGCYCVNSWGKLACNDFGKARKAGKEGKVPVKCSSEDEVVVYGELVETFCKVALVNQTSSLVYYY